MNKAFYDSIRKSLFGGKLTHGVVDTINEILRECEKYKVVLPNQIAYCLATAKHEAYHPKLNPEWLPVREGWGSEADAIATVTRLFNQKKISKNYALPSANGRRHFGRGWIQTTHDYNYKAEGKRMGLDLYNNPDLLLTRSVAADNLVGGMKYGVFTGKSLSMYLTATKTDYLNARRIVNGTDQAQRIADMAEKFYQALIIK